MRRFLGLGVVGVVLLYGFYGGSGDDGAGSTRSTPVPSAQSSECDPNYVGACLDPSAYDYDCADGEGDGPEYTGTVTVVGEDHYGLDADSDGTGCELG